MKKQKYRWCMICEVKIHATSECHIKLKNLQNYHTVYQTNVVTQNNNNNNTRNNTIEMSKTIKYMTTEGTSTGVTTIIVGYFQVEADTLGIGITYHVE